MELFVKKSERVSVDVWVWENKSDNKLLASPDQQDVPQGASSKDLKFIFRKPTYRDSNYILGAAEIKSENEVNPIAFHDAVIRTLLLEMHDEEEIYQMSAQRLSDLHPALARAAVAGVMDKISI